jgi:hypothetical protein
MLEKLSRKSLGRLALWALGIYPAQTQTTAKERLCLQKYAADRKHLVEIGVFNAVTTLELRQVMAPNAILWAVDPFSAGRLGFNADEVISRCHVRRCRNGTVQFIKLTGAEAGKEYARLGLAPVEFLFIDGDHSWHGIDNDWKTWHPLIAVGGIVALHDSRSFDGQKATFDSVRYTADVILQDPRFEKIEEVDSLTVVRRQKQ